MLSTGGFVLATTLVAHRRNPLLISARKPTGQAEALVLLRWPTEVTHIIDSPLLLQNGDSVDATGTGLVGSSRSGPPIMQRGILVALRARNSRFFTHADTLGSVIKESKFG